MLREKMRFEVVLWLSVPFLHIDRRVYSKRGISMEGSYPILAGFQST